MKELWLVYSFQEYTSANHRYLWDELAIQLGDSADVVVINKPEDMVVSTLKKRKHLLVDHRKGLVKLRDNLFLYRPLVFLRPEHASKGMNHINGAMIEAQLTKLIPDFHLRPLSFSITTAS